MNSNINNGIEIKLLTMILTKTINYKLNQFNSHHFKRIGYDVEGKDSIDVKIEDIGKRSRVKVEAQCDICGNIKTLNYNKYLKNISKYNFYSCSNKCSVSKGELTCLQKFGSKYPLQNEQIKKELKDYFLEKFGVENPSQSDSIKKKREKTMIEKFGVKTNIILPEIHAKAIQISRSIESDNKRKETNLEKYGFDNPMKSKEIYQKFKKTNLEKYGCEYPAQNIDVFNRTQLTGLKLKTYEGIFYQGSYELDLLKKLQELELINEVMRSKPIKYKINDSERVYFPDFYIKKYNLLLEVKSDYYFELHYEKNIAKQNTCINQGFNFLFIINKDYTEFELFLKQKDHQF
jgi:hypothetical protein